VRHYQPGKNDFQIIKQFESRMKSFYLMVALIGLVLILGSIVLPSSHGIPIDRMLVSHPQEWRLKFATTENRLEGLTEDEGKARLMHFLHGVHDGFTATKTWAAATSLALIGLGILGWRREISFERKFEPNAAPKAIDPRNC
jgi:hypothetical protein